MTLTIEVSNELESRLEAEARRKGVSKDEFVLRVNFQSARMCGWS